MSCDMSPHFSMCALLPELPVAAPPTDDTGDSDLNLDAQDDILIISLDGPAQERIDTPMSNKAIKRLFCESSEGELAWEIVGMNSILCIGPCMSSFNVFFLVFTVLLKLAPMDSDLFPLLSNRCQFEVGSNRGNTTTFDGWTETC